MNADIIGEVSSYTVRPPDTLYEIARQFDLGIMEVMAANPGVDIWMPEEGKKLKLPTAHILPPIRHGIVINLAELRLYYFVTPYQVMTFPIGTGKEGWPTPTGTTFISKKRLDPVWIPPPSIHEETPGLPDIIPAGPDNPLGTHALNLAWPGYAIHGTNRPYGVGKRSSHGCIRLYPEDIPFLFDSVDIGTEVTIIDTPYKLGWRHNTLMLEVSPPQRDYAAIMESRTETKDLQDRLLRFANKGVQIDWNAVKEALARRDGIPVRIGQRNTYN